VARRRCYQSRMCSETAVYFNNKITNSIDLARTMMGVDEVNCFTRSFVGDAFKVKCRISEVTPHNRIHIVVRVYFNHSGTPVIKDR
jgi:hypothetical protein